ncbi:MAG: hypothetical protein AB7G80_08880 [Dongiaceae bacterium]
MIGELSPAQQQQAAAIIAQIEAEYKDQPWPDADELAVIIDAKKIEDPLVLRHVSEALLLDAIIDEVNQETTKRNFPYLLPPDDRPPGRDLVLELGVIKPGTLSRDQLRTLAIFRRKMNGRG